MKILLIGNFVPDRQYSMLFFQKMLSEGLRSLGHEVREISPRPALSRFFPGRGAVNKFAGYADKFPVFFPAIRKTWVWPDVVHVLDHSNALYLRGLAGVPSVISCHDLIAVRSYLGELDAHRTSLTGRILQSLILKSLKTARHIVTSSSATARDCVRIIGTDPGRVHTIPYGLNFDYRPVQRGEAEKELSGLGIDMKRRFLMHVGSGIWYKNRSAVLDIFHRLISDDRFGDMDLVFVSGEYTGDIDRQLAEKTIKPRARIFKSLTHKKIRALYSLSAGLIFPSLYEGFGWPIIEAQACGAPVFTTDMEPMREVGGQAAVYIDPSDPVSSAGKIADFLRGGFNIREPGFANAKRFSAAAMTAGYVRIYEKCLYEFKERSICAA